MKPSTISVRLSEDLVEAINMSANEEGVSKTEWMRRALTHAVEEGLSYEVIEVIKARKKSKSNVAGLV